MTIASHISFSSNILVQPKTSAAAAKPTRTATPASVKPMSASLWRHTQSEDAAHTHHGLLARTVYFVLGGLGLGSVGYALWQMSSLMSGSHLHDAVSAFMR